MSFDVLIRGATVVGAAGRLLMPSIEMESP
jgi:hypothetical protein